MLLKALRDLAQDTKELPDFHARQEVRFRIDLDTEGKFVSSAVVADSERPKHGVEYVIPYVTRTSSPVPMPVDKGEYVLGIETGQKTGAEWGATTRSIRRRAKYAALLDEAAAQTGLPGFRAQHRFVSEVDANKIDLPDGFDPNAFVALYVDNALPTQESVAQEWWARRQSGDASSIDLTCGGLPPQVCGVCGAVAPPVKTVPVPIRGMTRVGGKATMALVSGNADVFERHGMERATGASICLECGNSTHQMLNQLIADDRHATTLGAAMYISWSTDKGAPNLINALVAGESDEAVGRTLRSILSGKQQPPVEDALFFCMSIGANAARVVVRSWTEVTLADAFRNIRRWFARIRVVDRDGTTAHHLGIFRLLAAVVPPGQGNVLSRLNPGLPDTVLAAALSGSALPMSLLAYTMGRLRADLGHMSPATAALVKACITPIDHPKPEDHMTALDLASTDPAYLCGRLLALLDDAARQATTRNNALVDRSYSAASTMPAITFTRLLRLHRAHIDKLRRDRPGAASRINGTVTEILGELQEFPRTLAITEQGRFALGLYHQQAAGHAAAQKAKKDKLLHEQDDDTDPEETEQ